MRIIYHCPRGLHAFAAAWLHLGLGRHLPAPDRVPLPPPGRLRYLGDDPAGNQVYILARAALGGVVTRALSGVACIFGLPLNELLLVDAAPPPAPAGAPLWAGRAAPGELLPRWDRERLELLVQATSLKSLRAFGGRRPILSAPLPTVFYVCYGSAHSSVVAAAIHIGALPSRRRATAREITALPDFDRLENSRIGTPIFSGADAAGREVYALGLASGRRLLVRTIHDLLEALGLGPGSVHFADALEGANWAIRVGGFLSRRLGLVRLGRPICTWGVIADYPRFRRLVSETMAALDAIDSRPPVADNSGDVREELAWEDELEAGPGGSDN